MSKMKSQWAIRAAIAAAGLSYIVPTVASHAAASVAPAPPAATRIVSTTGALSAVQSARQQRVDQLCAQIAGLNRVAQR